MKRIYIHMCIEKSTEFECWKSKKCLACCWAFADNAPVPVVRSELVDLVLALPKSVSFSSEPCSILDRKVKLVPAALVTLDHKLKHLSICSPYGNVLAGCSRHKSLLTSLARNEHRPRISIVRNSCSINGKLKTQDFFVC